MPCTSQRVSGANLALEDAEIEINYLTRMLCDTCQKTEVAGVVLSKETKEWWKKHKAFDLKRKNKRKC